MALAARVAFVVVWPRDYELPDTASYLRVADNIVAGRGFGERPDAQVSRAPVYPLFLAGCFSAFGRSLLAVRLLQAAVGALVCLPVFFLAKGMAGERQGLLAAAIAAIYPPFVFYTRLILSEALFIPLLPVITLGAVTLLERPTWGWGIGTGLALGATILLRPSTFLLWPSAMLLVLILSRSRWRALGAVALASLAVAAVLTPWAIRNERVTGHIVLTSLGDGWSLYEGNCAKATGGPAHHLVDWPTEELAKRTEYERNEFLRAQALRYIREHPGRFIHLTVVRLARMWSPVLNDAQFRTPLLMVLSAGTYVPLIVLGMLGLWWGRGRWRQWTLLVWPVLYYSAVHGVTIGSVRYRDPLMFAAIVAAAVALGRLCGARRADSGRRELSSP